MCNICGCGQGELRLEELTHHPEHGHGHGPLHGHGHDHTHGQDPPFTVLPSAPDSDAGRLLRLEQDLLAHNQGFADANRQWLAARGWLALNLVSSPGSGKTSLLARTLEALREETPLAVIEGDQQTSRDADRLRATGAPAIQINTGKGCHLDAHLVGHALESLQLAEGGILFIENVGNLVCPAGFDLGEAHKVVVLSVTEGEDKPLKYPHMFAAADLLLLNKIDLLPYLDFDVPQCLEYARRVNPDLTILQVSARTGAGISDWLDWLRREQRLALQRQVATLEARLVAARSRLT